MPGGNGAATRFSFGLDRTPTLLATELQPESLWRERVDVITGDGLLERLAEID